MIAKDHLIKKLCTRWDAPFPQLAIHEALRATFPNLQELSPPIHLGRLAALRGVADILKKELNCDGIISATSQGSYIIQVNRHQPEPRRRFTIAHEIGHTFFFDVDSDIRERVRDSNLDILSRSDPEELLCNYAAAEILMPRQQFTTAMRKTGPSAQSLINVGKAFNVSIQAATRRALQMSPLKLVVVQWEYDPVREVYLSQWVRGITLRKGHPQNNLVVRRNDPAFRTLHEKSAYRGPVWISLEGPLDGYFVDAVAWRHERTRRVLTTFVLERYPERVFTYRDVPVNDEAQMSLF